MSSPRVVSLAIACGLAAHLTACSSSDTDSGTGGTDGTGGTGGGSGLNLPSLDSLAQGWNLIEVNGGGAICSRGGDYAFFVQPGTVDRVVIEFEGGGACWDDSSCAVGSSSFTDTVDLDTFSGTLHGIHDHDNAANPYKDWHHVFVPYCTGDLHWGNATTDHGSVTIEHRGSVNTGIVLDWVYDNFTSPERVVVTGCSAGGYGAIGWAPYLMNHYNDIPVVQIADCAAGVTIAGFFAVVDFVWDASAVLPTFVPGLVDPNLPLVTMEMVYQEDAAHFSDQQFSQYNVQYDSTQISFYEDMGGDGADWSQMMNDSISGISGSTSNFSSFVGAGSQHCIIPSDDFYTVETDGVALRDWVNDLANGTAVSDVHCGQDCGSPD